MKRCIVPNCTRPVRYSRCRYCPDCAIARMAPNAESRAKNAAAAKRYRLREKGVML